MFLPKGGGAFFTDEIGDHNPRLQIKLVKALEEKIFRRIGGTENIHVTMRIIAATNRNLIELIHNGQFREDLFYRLNVVTIHPPPRRDRGNDIITLAEHFLRLFNKEHNKNISGFSNEAKKLLLKYPWPGTVRELKNSVERAVLLGGEIYIQVDDLNLGAGHIIKNFSLKVEKENEIDLNIPPTGLSLEALEKAAIEKALKLSKGNLSKTARLLKISRETLRYRIKKHKLTNA